MLNAKIKAAMLGVKTIKVFAISFETSNAMNITLPKKSIRPISCVTFNQEKKTAQATTWFATTVWKGAIIMNVVVRI